MAVQVLLASNLFLDRAIACHEGKGRCNRDASRAAVSKDSQSKQATPESRTSLAARKASTRFKVGSRESSGAKRMSECGISVSLGSSLKRSAVKKSKGLDTSLYSRAT
ncbi:MAG: hypothetical protein R6X07_00735 [Desulfatiglandales bacterium]